MATSLRPLWLGCVLLTLGVLAFAGCRPPLKAPPAAPSGAATGVAGVVRTAHGEPAAAAWVYAYRSPKGQLRGPADFAAETDAEGRYFLDLVAGHYWLVARLRKGGGDTGPPRPGDTWAIYPDNPARVQAGRLLQIDFRLQGSGRPLLGRNAALARSDTGFSGTVVGADGRPVAGIIVMAYPGTDFHRMPDFTALPSGEDGRFTLHLPASGRFCLAARARRRGQPVAGELYGLLGPGPASCREAREGQILDVGTLRVTPYHH